jgi:hypothetical protein
VKTDPIEKGNIFKGGKTNTNKLRKELASFFVTDFNRAAEIYAKNGDAQFLRGWFNYRSPRSHGKRARFPGHDRGAED